MHYSLFKLIETFCFQIFSSRLVFLIEEDSKQTKSSPKTSQRVSTLLLSIIIIIIKSNLRKEESQVI